MKEGALLLVGMLQEHDPCSEIQFPGITQQRNSKWLLLQVAEIRVGVVQLWKFAPRLLMVLILPLDCSTNSLKLHLIGRDGMVSLLIKNLSSLVPIFFVF